MCSPNGTKTSVAAVLVVTSLVWWYAACAHAQIPDGPYFGQNPPGLIPEVFAPGVISLPDRREGHISFSADGLECAFDVFPDTLYSRQENGHWLPWNGTVLGPNRSEPFFSPDGTRVFAQYQGDIYMSTREFGTWTYPARLPSPVNGFATGEYLPCAAMDDTLYFTSDRDGSGGGGPNPTSHAYAIYRAPLIDGAYPIVEKLGPEINGPDGAWDPYIAPDQSYLVFGIDRGDGLNTQIYLSYAKPDGSWTEPRDLGAPINTPAIEYGPVISPDGKYLFFGRPEGWATGQEPSDIWWVDSQMVFRPPAVATGEVARTNRYLRFVPLGGSTPEVIRIRIVSLAGYPVPASDILYVGPPEPAPEEDTAQPKLTFTAAPLQCEPYAYEWSAEDIVSVYGAEIMPGSTYEVQRAFASCLDGGGADECWSTPLTITTAKYGDVTPPFDGPGNSAQPDFNDVSALVDKFLAAPGAPIKAVAQLQPNIVDPSRSIDFNDIAAEVSAFLGTSYAAVSFGPCTCPSSVTCGATPCTGNSSCGTGLCIDGFCRDECGRCTP